MPKLAPGIGVGEKVRKHNQYLEKKLNTGNILRALGLALLPPAVVVVKA